MPLDATHTNNNKHKHFHLHQHIDKPHKYRRPNSQVLRDMAAPSNKGGPSHMAIAIPSDKKKIDKHGEWLVRQRMMLLDIKDYAGQEAPERIKHTRDQMDHMVPVLVSFLFPTTSLSNLLTPSTRFAIAINPSLLTIDKTMSHTQPMTHHLKKMKSPGEYLLNDPLGVDASYPPCATPLSDLKPLPSLNDLRVETHHTGRVLIVRTFCDPVRIEAFVNGVEDQDGNVDRLAVYNVSGTAHPERILPRGTIFAIKEPYYRRANDGGVIIRVDHPSNIMLLSNNDVLVPGVWREEEETFTAAQRKEHADIAANENQWHDAELLYTDAVKGLEEEEKKKDNEEKKNENKDEEKKDEEKKDEEEKKNDNDDDEGVTLRRTTLLNRANARLNIRHYELAHEDALKEVFDKPARELSKEAKDFNFKAYARAGRASYELGNFTEAKRCFDLAVTFASKSKAHADELATVKKDLRRVAKRLVEQNTGAYDFENMAASATATHRQLDHASFLGNTKVGPAGPHGRGLFATRDIRHSEIVMVEKALLTIRPVPDAVPENNMNSDAWKRSVEDHFHTERVYGLWKKLRGNPGQAAAFLDLYDGGKHFNGEKLLHKDVDGQLVVNMFQLRAILDHNAIPCPYLKSSVREDKPKASSPSAPPSVRSEGIWLRGSYTNHSCIPNAHRAFIGDMMIVRATKHIQAGEEILVHYVDPTLPYDARKKALADPARGPFTCDCPLCAVEAALDPAVLARRAQILREITRFLEEDAAVETTMRRPACEHTMKRVDVLLFGLHGTYDEDRYARLPRFGCLGLDLWLCETSWTPREVLSSAQLLLRDVGVKVAWKQDEHVALNRLYGGGVFSDRVLGGLLGAAAARGVMRCVCAQRLMTKCKLFAEEIHLTVTGEKLKTRPGQYSRPFGGVTSGDSGHVGGHTGGSSGRGGGRGGGRGRGRGGRARR